MTPEELHQQIKDIKAQFRLFMNGMVSQSMREKGLDYKLNFGIEYPRIKEIASGYTPSHELAQALWKENIRECKIMAGLLQPVDTFYPEIAEIWIEGMAYHELAEYTVMNLFQKLPYASEVVFPWMADDREYFQLCGFLLITRLLMKGLKMNERAEDEFIDQATVSLRSEYPTVARAAALAMKKFAAQSGAAKKRVQKVISSFSNTDDAVFSALIQSIREDL